MLLSKAIRQLKPERFVSTVHRIYDPAHGFFETIGSYLVGGRWNRKLIYGALYTSLNKKTAIAEKCRIAEMKNRKPSELGHQDYVVIRIRLTHVLNLMQEKFFKSLKVSPDDLIGNRTLCLQIADEARDAKYEALLVPSATKLGTNLVIYQDLLLPGWQFEEVVRKKNIKLSPVLSD